MEINIDIKVTRDLEDARDLLFRVRIGIGAAADNLCALLTGLP